MRTMSTEGSLASGLMRREKKLVVSFRSVRALMVIYNRPEVTGLADGGFVVVWQANDQDGSELGYLWPALCS